MDKKTLKMMRTNIKNEGLKYISAKSVCIVCKSRRVRVKYINNKLSARLSSDTKVWKYKKPKSYGFNLIEDEAWLDYYSRD